MDTYCTSGTFGLTPNDSAAKMEYEYNHSDTYCVSGPLRPESDTICHRNYKRGNAMSFAGIYRTNDYLVGFADRKATITMDGEKQEDTVRGNVQKIFEGSRFIVTVTGANQLPAPTGGMRPVESFITPLLGADSLETFFGELYKNLLYWRIPDTIRFCAGSTYRDFRTGAYEVRDVEIFADHKICDKREYVRGEYFSLIGEKEFCKYFQNRKYLFAAADTSLLEKEIIRLVGEVEKDGYCSVGKEIQFIIKPLE